MSINDDSYHSIDTPDQGSSTSTKQSPQQKQGYSFLMIVAVAALAAAFFFIIGVGVAAGDGNKSYDASKPYVSPNKAVITASFHVPYFDPNFAQTITAWVDHDTEQARVEYYSGMNVWIYNKAANTTNYQITPEYDRFKCYTDHHTTTSSLPNFFPKLQYKEGESEDDSDDHGPKLEAKFGSEHIQLYSRAGQETIRDVVCDKWFYSYIKYANNTDYETLTPDNFNHVGNYTFYVDAKTGQPVRFHMIGHNVFNGGSHLEEYYVDYHDVTAVEYLSPSLFAPPAAMPCVDGHYELSGFKRHRSPIDIMMGTVSHQVKRDFVHDIAFEQWAITHNKMYHSLEDRAIRQETFLKTVDMITKHNANPNKSYTMGLNEFADLTPQELSLLGSRHFKPASMLSAVPDACTQYVPVEGELPKSHDWRQDERLADLLNATIATRLKTQQSCGSCFAHGLIRAATAQHYLAYPGFDAETQIQGSVQHSLDCSNGDKYDNHACQGGIDFQVASYLLLENNGLVAEDTSYGHFMNANSFCHYAVNDKSIADINPWTKEPVKPFTKMTACEHIGDQWNKDEEVDLVKLVADTKNALYHHGVLSVSIAVPQSLYYYKSGIYDDAIECGHLNQDLTHTVILVAYDDEEDFWVLGNSWGASWGENSFARIKATGNVCGIATAALAIHVEKP